MTTRFTLNENTIEVVERELSDLIYGALFGERSWQDFLDRLNAFVPGGLSTLFFHDQRLGEGGVSLATGAEEQDLRDYAAYYGTRNPWMQQVGRTPLGKGIVGESIIRRDELVRTEYYADFLRRREIEAGIGVTLWRDEACFFLLSSLTSRIDTDHNQLVADLFTRLAPHLKRAFRHYRAGRSDEPMVGLGLSLLESSRVAVLIVGEGRTVKFASVRAAPFLAAGEVASFTATGRLHLRDEALDAMLGRMLSRKHAGGHSYGRDTGASRVSLIRTEADGATGFFSGPSVAVVIEQADLSDIRPDLGWLSRRFGLTPAETRVVAGIVAGQAPAGIARAAGTSRETVRGQLKAVFAKTGCASQVALMKLALSHPARR